MNSKEYSIEKNMNISILENNIQKLKLLQKRFKKMHTILLNLLKKYSNTVNENNTTQKYAGEVTDMLNNISSNIDISSKTMSLVRKFLARNNKLYLALKDTNQVPEKEYNQYQMAKQKYFDEIMSNYKTLMSFIKKYQHLLKDPNEHIKKMLENLPDKFSENTLVISEKEGKVFLPYTMKQINCCLVENPTFYSSVEDVINDVFTVPLKNYRHSSVSRFTEAYKLIREKEDGSIKDALDLACEVAFNYNLHPAVITACSNLNELDIYLACLEYNELKDFRYFNVVFDVAPLALPSPKANPQNSI